MGSGQALCTAVLEMEPRALSMLGKCPAARDHH